MSQTPPAALLIARQVFSYEAGSNPEPAELTAAADRADMRLRGRLAELFGATGYTILIARAQRLSYAELPASQRSTFHAEGDDVLHSVRDYVEFVRLNSDQPRAAETALTTMLAHIIGLLITFIGEDLALRLVYEAWPELVHDQAAAEGGT